MNGTLRKNQAHELKLHRPSLVDPKLPICNSRPMMYVRYLAGRDEEVTCRNCMRMIHEINRLEKITQDPYEERIC